MNRATRGFGGGGGGGGGSSHAPCTVIVCEHSLVLAQTMVRRFNEEKAELTNKVRTHSPVWPRASTSAPGLPGAPHL